MVAQVGLWTAAILGVLGVLALLVKGVRMFDNLVHLTSKELTHNGGSSMKDAIRRIEHGQQLLSVMQVEQSKQITEIWQHLAEREDQ